MCKSQGESGSSAKPLQDVGPGMGLRAPACLPAGGIMNVIMEAITVALDRNGLSPSPVPGHADISGSQAVPCTVSIGVTVADLP